MNKIYYFAIIILVFTFSLNFISALSLNLPTQTISNNYLKSTLITQESDSNSDGKPDVFTSFTQINNSLIEIKATQTNPNTKGGNAYKWYMAVCEVGNLSGIKYYNEDAQGGFTNSVPLNPNYGKLTNYGLPASWCSDKGNFGYVLFGGGSGNKTYRLNIPQGKNFKIMTGASSEQVLYEWINNTFTIHPTTNYQVDPFQISIYDCNGNQYQYPNINWTTNYSDDSKIVFYPRIGQTNLSCIRFRTNTLESEPQLIQVGNQFQPTKYSSYQLTFETFEAKNNLTSRNVTEVHPTFIQSFLDTFPAIWRIFSYQKEVLYYEIEYNGQIVDLDPELSLTITNTQYDAIKFNKTEGSATGARISAPVLSMDFNSVEENYTATSMYVKDTSLYNNFGTINMTGTRPVYNSTGSYIFDGTNDFITVPYSSTFSPSAQITVSGWFNTRNINQTQNILSRTQVGGYVLSLNANDSCGVNKLCFSTYISSAYRVATINSNTLENNRWYQVVGVYDGAMVRLYLDGVNVANSSISGTMTYSQNNPLCIGSEASASACTDGYYFNGSLDNIKVFARALSEEEISHMYTLESNNNLLKYSTTSGDFKSGVFYNSSSTNWNISLSTADATSRSGIVNADNSINTSHPNLVSYFSLNDLNDVQSIICDDNFTTQYCSFSHSGFLTGAGGLSLYGINDKYISSADATKWTNWTFSVPATNSYKIYYYLIGSASLTTAMPYNLTHADGSTASTFNQRTAYGWNLLGEFNFTAGNNYNFVVNGSGGVTIVDAIMLTPSNVSYNLAWEDPAKKANTISGFSSNGFDFNSTSSSTTTMNLITADLSNKNISNNVTVSFWMYPQVDTTEILMFANTQLNGGFELYYNTGRTIGVRGTGSTAYTSPVIGAINNWYHIVVRTNGTTVQVYSNGNLLGQGTINAVTRMPSVNIGSGRQGLGTAYAYNGYMDEVVIYNTSLTASEIQQLYKSGLSQKANTNVTLQYRTANTYNLTDPSLVFFLAMNNDTTLGENNVTIVDSSNHINFTCTTCPTSVVNGTIGNALSFTNSPTTWLSNSSPIATPLNGKNVTVSMWIRPNTNFGTSGYGLFDTRPSGVASMRAYSGSGNIKFDLGGGIGTISYAIPDWTNQWHHIVATNNYSQNVLYIDGAYITSATANAQIAVTQFDIGRYNSANNFNGLIDEVRVYNRSLSSSEVLDLYNFGTTHISDWTNYTNASLVTSNQNSLTSLGKFMQFKTNLNTNDTSVSPYVNSYNVNQFTYTNYAPQIYWLSQVPADISTQVVFENNTLITYNITDNDGVSALNTSNVTFFWKVNTSISNAIQFFLNGSNYQSLMGQMITGDNFFFRTSQWTNVSENWTQSLNGNEFLPATYNINEFIMETTPHSITTLTNTDDSIFVELLNISNQTQYNFFELMVNSTANAAPLQFYYCNESYNPITGGKVTTSPFCHLFNTLLNTQTFNHNHTNYSKHQVISMFINSTTGSTNSLKVTAHGYFVARMSGGTGDWYVYNIPNQSRVSTTKTSNSAGTVWNNQTYTFDSHLHQFFNDSVLRYYACASDLAGLVNCSTQSSDSLELGNLPPTSPNVYSPAEGSIYEDGVIPINWTSADSPNSYAISHYNVSLWNLDNTYNITIIDNTSSLGYVWDGTDGVNQMYGTWFIHVMAYDINNLTSVGISGNFSRLADTTVPFIEILKPLNNLIQDLVFPIKINATDLNSISRIWWNLDNGVNYTYTTETHSTTVNGYHTLYAFANDSYNNLNSTSLYFYAGNVQVNQSCPANNETGSWSFNYFLSNGSASCQFVPYSQGPAGQNGTNGSDGTNAFVWTFTESPGINCAYGGQRVVTQNNGVNSTSYVCNGASGSNGTSIVKYKPYCPKGGLYCDCSIYGSC